MPRGLTLAQKGYAAARIKRPAFFVQLDFTPVLRAWNGIGDVFVLGQTWRGVGEFGMVQGVAGSVDQRPHTATIGIMGLPGAGTFPSNVSTPVEWASPAGTKAWAAGLGVNTWKYGSAIQTIAGDLRNTPYQGKPVSIYIGFTDVNTDQPLGDPIPVFAGYADAMTYNLGSTFSVNLSIESAVTRLRRTNGFRMTTESHNARIGLTGAARDLFFDAQDRLMGVPRKVIA